MRRLAFFALAAAAGCAANPGARPQAAGPNIVLVMTDDQGYGDLGVTGNRVIDTPNIDAMARRSASMKTFYVSPVCAPTRACLMTGRYNYRTRAIDTWIGRAMMEPEEVTVAEVLRDAGYATGIFGKWHLGDCYPMRSMDQGFEESLVHLGGGLAQPSEPPENNRRYTDAILFRNGAQVKTKGYCTDVYFDAAMKWMERAHEAGRPFFAYVPTNAPHGPFHDVPAELYEKYKAKDLGPVLLGRDRDHDRVARIFAMIENVDRNMGRLFGKLNSLGITRETIVIFMVDNGPNSIRYVGDMRGRKGGVHEGGIRSPFFVHWPARLEARRSSDRIAAHIDVMPTLLDAAGVSVPAGLKLDGRSLLPLLEGKRPDWPDRTIVIQSHRGDAPVRYHHIAVRTQDWKLVRPSGFGNERPPANVGFELYDIAADPREEKNLADSRPEILGRLKAAYDKWFDDVSSTRPDNYAPPRIVIGSGIATTAVLTKQDWKRTRGRGWGDQGRWLLRVAGASRFDVTVRLTEPRAGKAELRIGETVTRLDVDRPTQDVTFKGVEPPAGDVDLTFALSGAGGTWGPYQVTVVRR